MDRINSSSSRECDWSGFAIELCVKKHSTSYSYKRLFYKRDADFLFPIGIERFLSDIVREEQVLEDLKIRVVQLTMPNQGTGSLSFSSNTMDLEIQRFQRLDLEDSIIWDAIDHDYYVAHEEFVTILDAINHDYYAAYHEEAIIIWNAMDDDDNSESLSNKERVAVQALKEVKVDASLSTSVECSICLESVCVGRIASQTLSCPLC
ncbi:hypothetical protein EZV62_019306 [Acer yangbiense]|uniref:Uncharacterized protein n=1 Tax=Acer yangbiense TaxID=1000413 RepID=A0A5C7HAL6_9ROSI|nr:hypothetical protein EZV62_019306 [Acer yangbiense]